jgi:LemA protein
MDAGFFLLIALAAAAAVVLFVGVVIYNRLVARTQQTEEGWSGIDVQLKRRANLIPNLIETVKAYAAHERGLLESITQARARSEQAEATGVPVERAAAEADMSAGLFRLFAVAENYPDLKANRSFVEMQTSLEEIESHIQMSRRYYNGAARDLNTLIGQFPGNVVAGMFGFRRANYFEIDDPRDRVRPDVAF